MRAFVAVKVPDGPSLSRPLEELSAAGGLRVYGAGDLHITLSFIGEIGHERLRDVSDAV
ncbi:MAG: 2'-5' RNA ligase family protein [Candidatus Methanomethylophilaceae archaeon]